MTDHQGTLGRDLRKMFNRDDSRSITQMLALACVDSRGLSLLSQTFTASGAGGRQFSSPAAVFLSFRFFLTSEIPGVPRLESSPPPLFGNAGVESGTAASGRRLHKSRSARPRSTHLLQRPRLHACFLFFFVVVCFFLSCPPTFLRFPHPKGDVSVPLRGASPR